MGEMFDFLSVFSSVQTAEMAIQRGLLGSKANVKCVKCKEKLWFTHFCRKFSKMLILRVLGNIFNPKFQLGDKNAFFLALSVGFGYNLEHIIQTYIC